MKIRIITASAGSGKTTRLSEVLDEAIGAGSVRPDSVIAMTFTKEAAAELIERARSRLLASGKGREAQKLLAARIGTVNSVCGGLVGEHAFEMGLSPALRVLDEGAADIEQKRALAAVISSQTADRLQAFQDRFERMLDWHLEIGKIIAAARANGQGPEALAACAERSIAAMDAALGPWEPDGAAIDGALSAAMAGALAAARPADTTKKTADYLQLLREAQRDLGRRRLRWGDWAKLCKETPGAKTAAAAAPVKQAAARHARHPGLRDELHDYTRLLFDVAARGLEAYQSYKRERGLLDFVDQEALALDLLRRDEVRAALAGQIDLVLVDEFQDTSPLQLAIFLQLAAIAARSVWVGDQKQAIYGFRGTDPALMDAVIESLTATSTDPELVRAAVEAVGRQAELETLSVSYRSRPELVRLTSDVFARAFVSQGIGEGRTRLEPARASEPPGLGPIVEHWPLDGRNKDDLAAAVAAGVRELLARGPLVRDRATGEPRAAGPGDVAVLCRTNAQCQDVAQALADLAIPAVVPMMRLLDTVEGQLAAAGLRLWLDPWDALARAQIARLVTHPTDLGALVARALAQPGRDAFAADPTVAAILRAREGRADAEPVAALDAVIDAAGLRELCAAWGNSAQRQANLDALRAHAVAYARETEAGRDAATLPGLLRRLDELADPWGWTSSRADRQALLRGDDAVTLSTWHRAKGREWPLTILFGLETVREPLATGLHVESDAAEIDLARPLAGRWLRYWPNPYSTFNQLGPVRDAFERSPAYAAVTGRSRREALRLVYVGWTRARDRLILAAAAGKLCGGLLGTLSDAGLIAEPPGDAAGERDVVWAGRPVRVHVAPSARAPAVPRSVEPGMVTIGLPPAVHAPARFSPSLAPQLPCVLGEPVRLGPRLALRGSPDMERVGRAMHGFLAADRPELDAAERLALARELVRGHDLEAHQDPADLVEAGTRLWRWLAAQLAPARIHREWPVTERLPSGTVVAGAADLVVRAPAGLGIIDHKTFPGGLDEAMARVPSYSGQLAAYASAIAAATGEPVASMWVHLPILGVVVEVNLR